MTPLTTVRASLWPSFGSLLPVLRAFGVRGWLVAAGAALASVVIMGIPTVMFDNPWFRRMTPTRPQDYVFWVVSAVLIGLIAGTFVGQSPDTGEGLALAGGFLSYLAIGCPICNKVVVLLLGISGALTWFGPAQLFIGIASLALLGWSLLLRASAVTGGTCPVPAARRVAQATEQTLAGPTALITTARPIRRADALCARDAPSDALSDARPCPRGP